MPSADTRTLVSEPAGPTSTQYTYGSGVHPLVSHHGQLICHARRERARPKVNDADCIRRQLNTARLRRLDPVIHFLVACASPAVVLCTIDGWMVIQAAANGMSTSAIAEQLCCTPRRIQQILAFSRPPADVGLSPPQPQPPAADALLEMVGQEIQRHGDYYGVQMLLGALRQWHPEHHFPRRAVAAAAAALRPDAYRARR